LQIGKGNEVFVALGSLLYEGDEVFAEHAQTSPATLFPLPPKLRLNPSHLELIQEPSAGRPATYYYRMIVAVP
jgi:hypothetical protein